MKQGTLKLWLDYLKPLGVAGQNLLIVVPLLIAVPELFGSSVGLNESEILRITQATIFLAGLMTLLHRLSYKYLGSKAKVVIGADLAILAIGIRAASETKVSTLFGIMIFAGIFSWMMGHFVKKWYKFVTPAVLFPTLLLYCISFLPVALDWFMGGVGSPNYGNSQNVLVGAAVLSFTLFLNQYGKGFLKSGAIGLGMIVGMSISLPLGLVNLELARPVHWVTVPEIIPYMPSFELETLKWILPVLIIVIFKQVMDLSMYAKIQGYSKEEELSFLEKGIKTNAVGYGFTFLLGAVPTSVATPTLGFKVFSQADEDASLLIVGLILLLSGCLPMVAFFFTIMPLPVLGAIGFLLIASLFNLIVSRMALIKWDHKALIVASLSFLFGLLSFIRPEGTYVFGHVGSVLFGSSIFVCFLTAMFLELVIPEN